MKRFMLVVGLIILCSASGFAQATIDVLIVDETEGLIESLAINTIVGLLRQQAELFGVVDAVISPVASRYDLPFMENPTGQRYDLVIVAPKGVLAFGEIWLLTRPYPQSFPALVAGMTFLSELAAQFGQQFGIEMRLVDVNEDLFLGILADFLVGLDVL